MREIKFQGKRVDNGEWVYGYPIIVSYKAWIKDINDTTTNPRILAQDFADFRCVEVEKETVGQYTGLKDRNGVDIYEGDVLECKVSSEMFVVEFDAKTAQFTTKSNWLWSILDRCEVVANIHDNPELMGEKK